MCGRFANVIRDPGGWTKWLDGWPFGAETGYNIAPSRNAPVLYLGHERSIHQSALMRWGLVPSWSRTIDTRYSTFNARSETLSSKPAFRTAWQQSRTCMVPALGYYEWTGPKTDRQPFFFRMRDNDPIMMAGIWDCFQSPEKSLFSFTIITMPARGPAETIHSRMPLRIKPNQAENWLRCGTRILNELLDQQDSDDMEIYPVGKAVNHIAREGSGLIGKSVRC